MSGSAVALAVVFSPRGGTLWSTAGPRGSHRAADRRTIQPERGAPRRVGAPFVLDRGGVPGRAPPFICSTGFEPGAVHEIPLSRSHHRRGLPLGERQRPWHPCARARDRDRRAGRPRRDELGGAVAAGTATEPRL